MSEHERSGHGTVDHNPTRTPGQHQHIGVRALLGAGGHEPRIALLIPGVPQQVRLSAAEAEQLASALVQTLGQARACLTPPPVQAGGARREARGDEEEPGR